MDFVRRLFEGILMILGGWLALICSGFLAGLITGTITAGLIFWVVRLLGFDGNLVPVAAILAGFVAFWKTLIWFATLGGLLRRR